MASTSEAALLGQVEPQRSLGAWEKAKARFLEGLDDAEKATFTEATAENIFYAASNVQRDDHRDSKTRSLLESMQPLISAVGDYGKAMDTFANISSLYLAPIWGSIRVVLVIASSHGRFYNRMVDTFGRIGDILPRFRDYQRIFDSEKHQRFTQALSVAYLDIISLCTEFKTLLRNQKKSAAKRIFQPLSLTLKVHLEDAIVRFRKHRKAVDKEAELCHMIEEKEARDLVVRNHAAAEARKRQNRQKTLLSSLSKTDNEYKHRRMQRIRHKGTGEWFKSSDEYKAWSSCAIAAILCLYGIPGCGKSVLISSLIDEMLAKDNSNTGRNIMFYYCDHADKRTLDPVNIFSSLALQLLRTLGELPTTLLEMLERICQDSLTVDLEDVLHLLLKAIERAMSATIVIDGLDEVDENDRKLIFHHLRDIATRATPPIIKVLVASREDTSYLTQVPDAALFKRRIGIDVVAGDIDCYVKHAIRDLINRKELVIGDPALEEEIFGALSKGAKGMFLWVKFQLDDLCRAETDSSIRKVLQNLPRNLGETYDRLLTRIDNAEQREYVKRIFMWIICARRPLEIEELREAIAFTIEDDHFDHTKIPNDLNRLARACGNLIVIDDDKNSIQIAHYTVEQHLLKEDGYKPALLHFTRAQASVEVGKVCVAYLSFSDFELQLTQYEDTTTSKLAALEDVVRTQSMLPPNSQTAKLVKTLKWFRGSPETSTNIRFDRYVAGGLKWRKPADSLKSKYRLLSYLAENWLHHNTIIGNVRESRPWSPRHLCLFENLVLEKRGSLDIRPWDSIPLRCIGFPFVLQIGWALSTNHLPLLRTISKNTRGGSIGDYLEHATKAFIEFSSTSSGDDLQSLRGFSGRSTEIWPNSEDWECWLYNCVLKASNQSFTDVLEFCFSVRAQYPASNASGTHHLQITFIRHLLLDAATHSATSVVEVLAKIVRTWPAGMRSELRAATKITDAASNALEMAFLSKSEHLMELLASLGFEASASFKERLLLGSSLPEALKSYDVENVRCYLRIFGATKSSLSNIECCLHKTSGSTAAAGARVLKFLVDSAANSISSGARTLGSHWIRTLRDGSIDDQINVLLAAGKYSYFPHASFHGKWLLFDAIIENKPIRLDLLLQKRVDIYDLWELLTNEQVDTWAQFGQLGRKRILKEGHLSPLCFAILYDRSHMIERLLASGGSVDGPFPGRELAPIHFAAMSDSLESFKCLESHGANLSLTDGEDRNMMDYLLDNDARKALDKSLLHYLVEHRKSYLQYSWSRNPAFINRKV